MSIEISPSLSQPKPTIKLWTPNTIGTLTFFLGFPAGIVLAAINWIKMGMTRKIIPHIFIGIAGIVAIIFLPDNLGRIVGLALSWGYIAFFRKQMKNDIEKLEHFDVHNARWYSGFFISIGLYGIVFAMAITFALLETEFEKMSPDHAAYYANRGDDYLRSGNYDMAITEYTRAIELESNSRALYYSRGFTYNQKGDFENAIDDLTFVFTLPENSVITNAMVYFTRGQAYEASGKHELALSDFTEFIKLQPNDAYGYTNRAFSFESLGQIEKAIQDMEQALILADDLGLKQSIETEITRLKGK